MNDPAWREKRQVFSVASRRGWSGLASLAVCFFLLAACSGRGTSAEAPLPTRTPTSTPRPTKAPPTTTHTPFNLDQLVPVSTPARIWEGIPIMPGALVGGGDDLGYTFTIHASTEEVTDFYKSRLPDLGWQQFADGSGGPDSQLLVFMQGSQTLTVSFFPHNDGLLVLLVR